MKRNARAHAPAPAFPGAASLSLPVPARADPAPPQPRRVFVIGDSISMHYSPWLEKFLAPSFEYDRKRGDAGGNLDVPQGANGGDSRSVLSYLRFRHGHAPIKPGFLLLNCGLHDIKRHPVTMTIGVGLSDYAANLREMLKTAAAMRQRVVWVRTTPVLDENHNSRKVGFLRFAADVAACNRCADGIMRAAGVPVVDLHTFSDSFGPEAFADHVHYINSVREKQAAFIAGAIKAIAECRCPDA
ncbi:MAG: SGNH/GDSL hydrolase family protein [Opitutaceae bacterium]|jgi:hypothetical protein|nr:SGNH/GDSL hydrolase family protein [Opitutaceae bacterium]